MAAYAPLRPQIWSDEDFRRLTVDARLLYLYLISHPKLTRVGLVPLVVERWSAQLGYDCTAALGELEADRYVVVDRDTYEALVRTKVRHDPPSSWQQTSAVWKSWQSIESPRLAAVVVEVMPVEAWSHERSPAPVPRPDTQSDGVSEPSSDPASDTHPDTPSDTHCDGVSDTQSDTPLCVTPSPPPTPSPAPSQSRSGVLTDDDEDPRVEEALGIIALRRAPTGGRRYLARVAANLRAEEALDVEAVRLCAEYPDAPAGLIAARLVGDDARNLAHFAADPHADCPTCRGSGWVDSPTGGLARCLGPDVPIPEPAQAVAEPEPDYDAAALIHAIPRTRSRT